MKKLIFIEGSIASGKSTLLKFLQDKGFIVLDEPLDKWQTDYVENDGTNILDLFYKDMTRWSFQLEVAIMTTRYQRLLDALNHENNFVVLERSLWTDRKTFAYNLYKDKKMTDMEWKIYVDWFDTFMRAINHQLETIDCYYLYLHTSAIECHKRLKIRNRSEEKLVPLEYLQDLETSLLEWLHRPAKNIFIVDGNNSQDKVIDDTIKILDNIKF